MKKLSTIIAAAALAGTFALPVAGFAQNLSTNIFVAPDHSMSAKSLVGVPVYNRDHQKIGTIETIMVKPTDSEAMVVLSIGDYLGTGPRMVAVPMSHLQLEGKDAMMMPDASKTMLDSLPIYSLAGG